MIRFRCSCGQGLQVPETEAGGSVQCPRCGRLRSVPPLEELGAMEEDGTIRMAADAPSGGAASSASGGQAQPPNRVVDYPRYTDPWEVDRRSTLEQILKIGTVPEPPPRHPHRPRYDPETGELVRELDLAPPNRQDIPPGWPEPIEEISRGPAPVLRYEPRALEPAVAEAPRQSPPPGGAPAGAQAAAPVALGYAHRHDYGKFGSGQVPIALNIRPVYWYSIPLELLQPANMAVMGFVFVIHLVIQGFSLLTIMGALPLVLVVVWLWLVVFAHYVIVIDETGPERRDELPGILRNVSLGEDFFGPLWAMLTAIALCFGPAAAISRAAQWGNLAAGPALALTLAAAGLGLLLFPATLLTAATSGSILNLAPHRIFGVILAAPGKYLLTLPLLAVTMVLYLSGVGALGYATAATIGFGGGVFQAAWLAGGLGYLGLMLGIYGAHWLAWLLGKIYQEHHESFPWVLQRHISTRTDPTKQLERQRAAQILAEREEQARRASRHVRERLSENL